MFNKFADDTRQGLLVSLVEDRIRIQNCLAELEKLSEKKLNRMQFNKNPRNICT